MNSGLEIAKNYCSALDEIRQRLLVVKQICLKEISIGSEGLDSEIIAINLRKILEGIAFGSLTANQDAYTSTHADIHKVWQAKKLLDRLEKIHSEFYPKAMIHPIISQVQGVRHLHFDVLKAGFLERSEFVELYDACSQIIHSQNPFSSLKAQGFKRPPLEWVEKITKLLTFHRFRLAGHPQLWLGELEGPDGRSHVSIASPT